MNTNADSIVMAQSVPPARVDACFLNADANSRWSTDQRPSAAEPVSLSLVGLVELILKRRETLERVIRDPQTQGQIIPRLLLISLLGFAMFGIALSLVFGATGYWPRLVGIPQVVSGEANNLFQFSKMASGHSRWIELFDGRAFALMAAYAVGLIAATGICMPSLYFYSLLAGVKMSLADVVVHSLKAKASAAIALTGILPIYAILGLGVAIFSVPEWVRNGSFYLGMALPFVAGLYGTFSLYRGFLDLADTMPVVNRFDRRCFLSRLVMSWSACYTAVTPTLIYTLWFAFSGSH